MGSIHQTGARVASLRSLTRNLLKALIRQISTPLTAMTHAPAHIVFPSFLAGVALAGVFWYAQRKNLIFGHEVPHTMTEEWKLQTEAMNACKERESSDVPVALNPFYHNYPASFKNSKNL